MVSDAGNARIDLIIPLKGEIGQLDRLLESLAGQASHIQNVFVIASGENLVTKSVYRQCPIADQPQNKTVIRAFGIQVTLLSCNFTLYPGRARNLGLSASEADYVGFLDANTIPEIDWLNKSISIIKANRLDVLLGSTCYSSSTYIQKVILASSYGFKSLQTLPGTIISREGLNRIGYFLPDIRAAEDIAFMAKIHSLYGSRFFTSIPQAPPLTYRLNSSNPAYYAYKWFRNYASCEPYMSLSIQSLAASLFWLSTIFVLVYSWNALLGSWSEESLLYFPNITKIYLSSVCAIYIGLRGFLLPSKRGSFSHGGLTVLDIPSILAASFLLDASKLTAMVFVFSRRMGELLSIFL